MAGTNILLVARYIVFALFTICNAITCSVAVWNYSLVYYTQPAQVDVYLIFLGAFSLVSIFTLIFIELLCVRALTTRVWFECAWVVLFWVMQLAGGTALIAIESDIPCLHRDRPFVGALCTSERVLLAFTWACAIMLLVYLLALVFVAAAQHYEDPRIWVSDNSPLTTRFKMRPSVDMYTPRTVRAQPVKIFHHPADLDTGYEIEPFRPVFAAAPEQMDIAHVSNLPEAIPLPPSTTDCYMPSLVKPDAILGQDRRNVVSLSLSRFDMPQELKSTITYANAGVPPSGPIVSGGGRAAFPFPPPLGDWPRQDIIQQPARPNKSRRRSPPEFPVKRTTSTERGQVDTSTQPRPRRPSGPRPRDPSLEGGNRPAPLNLAGISNYETRRRDDAV